MVNLDKLLKIKQKSDKMKIPAPEIEGIVKKEYEETTKRIHELKELYAKIRDDSAEQNIKHYEDRIQQLNNFGYDLDNKNPHLLEATFLILGMGCAFIYYNQEKVVNLLKQYLERCI
jgi:hypothetical protein